MAGAPATAPLRDTQNAFFEIRHQHGVFVDLGLAPVHESKFQLALLFLGGNQMLFEQAAENDHPALLPGLHLADDGIIAKATVATYQIRALFST
ncbi:hypothetical protein BBC27_00665 [Acidithiobacillus ferrivorans]|uniref:Uncharacterized protein n=1 Tax=Acidithiobacillus ferrivorans TaxID=160808 RepID=A0A1B9C0Y5_9PROT|nr:hypothetical protein [Acidithiobacillus ferrivorans]OCB03648.1 hypothetical protein BBC27_00665 [Acidithiobacillus ferrivorans]